MESQDALDSVEDMREHDVPQHWRWAIDNDMRAGYWYTVTAQASRTRLLQQRSGSLGQRDCTAEPREGLSHQHPAGPQSSHSMQSAARDSGGLTALSACASPNTDLERPWLYASLLLLPPLMQSGTAHTGG